eukprot:11159170-Lingulodinium_polyedra.AAC.1
MRANRALTIFLERSLRSAASRSSSRDSSMAASRSASSGAGWDSSAAASSDSAAAGAPCADGGEGSAGNTTSAGSGCSGSGAESTRLNASDLPALPFGRRPSAAPGPRGRGARKPCPRTRPPTKRECLE